MKETVLKAKDILMRLENWPEDCGELKGKGAMAPPPKLDVLELWLSGLVGVGPL